LPKVYNLIYGYLLCWRASIAVNLHFLTQFMRSHGLLFFNVTSCIFSSKKIYLVFLTNLLKLFQSSIDLENWYTLKLALHFLFHYALECLVILTFLENLYQIESEIDVYSWTIPSRDSLLDIFEVFLRLMMNFSSSSLFLIIVHCLSWINSSLIDMSIVKGALEIRITHLIVSISDSYPSYTKLIHIFSSLHCSSHSKNQLKLALLP